MLYVWETLKQFFQVVLLLYSGPFIVAGTMWYGSATPIDYFIGNSLPMGSWILQQMIDQRVQTSLAEGKSLPEAWAQIRKTCFL
jgi:photosystem II CP47 chlorophyll apoprotein